MANTMYTVADTPLSWRHWWITFVTSLGQFIGTLVATIAGVIIPMLAITTHGELNSWMQGLIGAADLIGIVIGSLLFGNLTDKFGYLPFFRLCPLIMLAGSLLAIFVPDTWVLITALFIVGIGIGGEYSLDSDYESVLMPDKYKTVMLGIVKTGASLGNIIGAAMAFALVVSWQDAAKWPDLMWIVTIVALVMFLTRIYFFESPKWLINHGKPQKAIEAVRKLLGPNVEPTSIANQIAASASAKASANIVSGVSVAKSGSSSTSAHTSAHISGETSGQSLGQDSGKELSTLAFCKKYWNRVMLSGMPWACEGLGVYGIGVFIPILVMALGLEHQPIDAPQIAHVAESVKTTIWISLIMLPGFLIGVWVTSKKVNYATLQVWTFWVCAASLALLLFSYSLHWPDWISLMAFMSFELFLNLGPHLVTYLLPPEIYPIEIRGQGTGIAAALGKVGAVLGVFIIPLLLKWGGSVLVLGVSAAVMAAGAIITAVYARRVFKNPEPS